MEHTRSNFELDLLIDSNGFWKMGLGRIQKIPILHLMFGAEAPTMVSHLAAARAAAAVCDEFLAANLACSLFSIPDNWENRPRYAFSDALSFGKLLPRWSPILLLLLLPMMRPRMWRRWRTRRLQILKLQSLKLLHLCRIR